MPDLPLLVNLLQLAVKDRTQLALENIALRHQLAVYKRSVKRPNIKDGEVPLRWDPTFLLPMLRDGLVLARPVDDDGLPGYFEARQVVYDEQRRETGSAVLVAEVLRDGEKISCRGPFVDARYRLEIGE